MCRCADVPICTRRYRGTEVQKCRRCSSARSLCMQVCRGGVQSDVQVCRCADVQRRCADVKRRCADVQMCRCAELQMCKVEDVQRSRGGAVVQMSIGA